jgi:hypothetical protein
MEYVGKQEKVVRLCVREKEATSRWADRHSSSDARGTRHKRKRRSTDEPRERKRD